MAKDSIGPRKLENSGGEMLSDVEGHSIADSGVVGFLFLCCFCVVVVVVTLNSCVVQAVWVCKLCTMKREVSCRTGGWYHGARGHAYHDDSPFTTTAADALRRKLQGFNVESTTGSEYQVGMRWSEG